MHKVFVDVSEVGIANVLLEELIGRQLDKFKLFIGGESKIP